MYRRFVVKLALKSGFTSAILTTDFPSLPTYLMGSSLTVWNTLFRTTYPNKVFDYMAAGRAVLLGIDGVIREVVDDARAGIFVRPGDGDALAHAVRSLMDAPQEVRAMGERGHAVVCQRFARQVHGRQLDTLLRGLVSSRPSIASVGQIEQQPYGDDESAEKMAARVSIG